MFEDITNAIAKLGQAKGLRSTLWLVLIFSISIFVFESLTQYFAINSLQARINLVASLSKMTGTEVDADKISSMYNDLVNEAVIINKYHNDPASFILECIVRFIKGAYISLPIFYFLFKLAVAIFKHLKDQSHKTIALWFSSVAFSAATWLATILGVVSVVLNTSSSILISWIIFPFTSLFLMMLFVLWLAILRISIPSVKNNQAGNIQSVNSTITNPKDIESDKAPRDN